MTHAYAWHDGFISVATLYVLMIHAPAQVCLCDVTYRLCDDFHGQMPLWTHSRHRDHTAVSCNTLDPPLPWRTGGGMRQGGVGCNIQCNTYEAFPIKIIAKSHKNADSGFRVETCWSQTDPAT